MAFTFFFRDMSILDLIGQHVVPAVSGFTRVRVWDAGCAMGPEPYSLAIVIAERMGHFMFRNVRIDATDIDEQDQFGKIIIAGIYPEEPLKRIPQDLFARYFEPADEPGQYRVVQMVRDRIHFQKHDLLSMTPIGASYHLIMCKNVLLHFQQQERAAVIRMFHAALAPGGFFATEQTQKLPDEVAGMFEQVSPEGQLFRKLERAP
ncbi:MAG: chemotaxis protein CheR [Ignavibacteriae bacterium]|nr:chemotaxis protein CheR [Ignavibacteriota bacterium]